MTKSSLPRGWRLVKFGDLVRKVNDRVDPESSGISRYVAGEHMDTNNLSITRWGVVGDGYLGPAFTMRFQPGQTLYGSRRTYLRKVAMAHFQGICANTTFVLESKSEELLQEFLPHVMSTEKFHEYSISKSKGSVNPYINFVDLNDYEFALPPIAEQRRISKVLGTLDLAVESFSSITFGRTVSSIVQSYKESELSRWTEHSLGDISELVSRGRAPSYCDQGGVVVLNQKCIRDGKISLEAARKTDSKQREIPSWAILQSGDVLINSTGTGTLGRTAYVTDVDEPITFDSHITLVRVNRKLVEPAFLALDLHSRETELERVGNGSTGQSELNRDAIKRLRVLVPSIDIQIEILNLVKALRKTENQCRLTIRKLCALRQAILSKTVLGNSRNV